MEHDDELLFYRNISYSIGFTKDKKEFAKNMIEDEEELQEESTTAAYLTEQKQSDKRNKKTEVKNQSFKERYEPKTHWQLEELRRYGL